MGGAYSTAQQTDGTGDDPAAELVRTVALVGLMGAGKTTVGRQLAAMLDVTFVDADQEIEKAAGCSVADIFEQYGEEGFRDGERKVIARLLDGPPCVLATGGGAFMNDETRALLLDRTATVWLDADLDTLVSRTEGRTHRPLLNAGNPRDILARLMAQRYPVYAQAHMTVRSENTPDKRVTARKVIEALSQAQPPVLRGIDP